MGGAGGGQTGSGQTTTCDPLAPAAKPISWATIIAGGRSAAGTVYAADQTADGIQRVFVSEASGTLVRQRSGGASTITSASGTVYIFSVTDTSAPFVLQIDTSTAPLRMGVVQGTLTDRKTFVIGQDGEELTVLPSATIAAMPVRNLPGTIVAEYVATLPDGRLMLVTRPQDDWSYEDFRLFLGPPTAVVERQVASVTRFKDGGTTTILFDLDGVEATAYFPVVLADAGFAAGAATLTVGAVVTPLTRGTTPPSGAAYLCFGVAPVDAGSDATAGGAAGGTLATGVDQAALIAAVTPQVIAVIRATAPGVNADNVVLGRPWGEFELHKGPRLVFLDRWSMLASSDGSYFTVVGVARDGDSYKWVSIGSDQFVPTMVARESLPAVSAALDRGRAGFLRCVGDGGYSLLAYEAETAADAGQVDVMVQPLVFHGAWFAGIDAGAGGVPEMSLDELDPFLPVE